MAASDPLRCVGALVLDDDGRIFVQRRAPNRRPFPNCWDIVRGQQQAGGEYESDEDTLRRRLAEDTGWRLSHLLAELDEIAYTGDDGIDRVERDFLVRVEGNLFSPHLADEYTEWRWIDQSQLDLIDEQHGPGDRLAREIVTAGFRLARDLGFTGG